MQSTLRKPDAAFISLVNTINDQCIAHAGEWKLVPDTAIKIMGLRSRIHHSRQPLPVPTETPTASIVRRHDEIIVQATGKMILLQKKSLLVFNF
jgi:hypothetical protein